MSEEENQKAEDRLRRYAEERRRRGGGDWEIPRVTASLLRAEHEQRWGRPAKRARPGRIPGGWLPWGLAFGLGLIIGIVWEARERADARRVALLSRIEQEKEVEDKSGRTEGYQPPEGRTRLLAAPSNAPQGGDNFRAFGENPPPPALRPESRLADEVLERKKEPQQTVSNGESAAVAFAPPSPSPAPATAPAPEGLRNETLALRRKAAAQARSFAPSAKSQSGTYGQGGSPAAPARSFAPSASTWFFQSAAASASGPPGSANGILFGNQTPTALNQPTAGPLKPAQGQNRDLAFQSTPRPVGGVDPVVSNLPVDSKAAETLSLEPKQDRGAVSGALTNSNAQAVPSAVATAAQPAAAATAGFQVLESFYLTRQGNLVTITDADGSVYRGTVETGKTLEEAQHSWVAQSKDQAARSVTPLSADAERPSLSKRTGGDAQAAASSTNAVLSATGSPAPVAATLFRVSGTNLSTREEVDFDAYMADGEPAAPEQATATPAQGPAAQSKPAMDGLRGGGGGFGGGGGAPHVALLDARQGLGAGNTTNAGGPPTGTSTVVGRATLGRTNQVEIRAKGAPAQAR